MGVETRKEALGGGRARLGLAGNPLNGMGGDVVEDS